MAIPTNPRALGTRYTIDERTSPRVVWSSPQLIGRNRHPVDGWRENDVIGVRPNYGALSLGVSVVSDDVSGKLGRRDGIPLQLRVGVRTPQRPWLRDYAPVASI